MLFHAAAVLLSFTIPFSADAWAQSVEWTPVEACAGLPSLAPNAPFDGLLAFVADDAIRAFRAGVPTTYVLSFAGGNFLAGGAVSPDGRHYAVPHGIVNTVTTSDVRYVVQEIRIVTTETVPRIVERIPWRASFPVGTRFTSFGDIPRIHWLTDESIQFVSGTLSEGHVPVTMNVFEGTENNDSSGYDGYAGTSWSPDGARAVTTIDGVLMLQSVAGDVNVSLPQTPPGVLQIAWSPDSTSFAMTVLVEGALSLRQFDKDGEPAETIVTFPPEQVLWNLAWSPSGNAIAFTAFDPQTLENRLHVADTVERTVTDTCLPVVADIDGRWLSGLAWSPDGTRIALLTGQTSAVPQVQIYTPANRTRYALVQASGRLLGWFP